MTAFALACPIQPELWQATQDVAERYGLEPEFLGALVWQESRYCVDALNPTSGAIGLGQLMPGTAVGLGVNPYVVEENLDGAARYLVRQFEKFGSWSLALAAYNAGPGRVVKLQTEGLPLPLETQSYVPEVLQTYHLFKEHTRAAPAPLALPARELTSLEPTAEVEPPLEPTNTVTSIAVFNHVRRLTLGGP